MACGCKGNTVKRVNYVVTKPDGSQQTYSSEIEAKRVAERLKGTVRAA